MHAKRLGLLQPSLRVSGAGEGNIYAWWSVPHCVTLGVALSGAWACSLSQLPAKFSTIFHGSGLTLELSRGLYDPPPSSVTSVNGFLITHINQHDWKFLKFYWEGNL